MRILALMSGGLDSSMAVVRLLDRGDDVVGVTYRLVGGRSHDDPVDLAAGVARHLGIEHHLVDLSATFEEEVLAPLAAAYAAGVTPNPCVLCNPAVKLTAAVELARRMECDRLATGHYARVDHSGPTPRLLRGLDRSKDQSYFLYRVPESTLAQLELPLGESSKQEVRAEAQRRGLQVWNRPESQDVCFDEAREMVELVAARHPEAGEPGEIVDGSGRVLGVHGGIGGFTVGQRRGLGIGGGPALYVIRIDPEERRVVVGPRDSLATRTLHLRECIWRQEGPDRGLTVMPRYRSAPLPCMVQREGSQASVHLDETLYGGAPGQSAVVYEGDTVVGGGFIAAGEG